MKNTVKKVARQLLPDQFYTKIASIRSRNYQRKFLEKRGLLDITEQMIERYGTSVLHGPFQGMVYPRGALVSRHGTPKLLGSYEKELHGALAEVIANADQYDHFVDIGCAEGYYAVGLAKKTGKQVYAFDTEPRELAFCREMATLNQVTEKIIFRHWCDASYLGALKGNRCFIISDCEGYEAQLFNSEAVRGVAESDLLIELHNIDGINMSQLISERFKDTHHITMIASEARQPEQYQELDFLGDKAQQSISEYRGHNQLWASLKSKSQSSNQN